MKKIILVLIILLSACSTTQPRPIINQVLFETPIPPTATPSPTATPTETPISLVDLNGSLFFDYNGSGLWENGEPPITGFGVCVKANQQDWSCTQTDDKGTFIFESIGPEGAQLSLKFEDPNVEDPTLAFRYINLWRGPLVIEAYEINGVRVPEQHLNDTEIIPIDEVIDLEVRNEIELGLMQGFLTMPFSCSSDYLLWSYVDLDYKVGELEFIRDFTGDRVPSLAPSVKINDPLARSGISDNHQGIDYYLDNGTPLLAMSGGVVLQSSYDYHLVRIGHFISNEVYVSGYAHNQINLVSDGESIHRGQIIAFSGDWNNGKFGGTNPHVHSSFWIIPKHWESNPLFYLFESGERETIAYPSSVGYVWTVDDPYRDLTSPLSVGYWTVDNDPQCLD